MHTQVHVLQPQCANECVIATPRSSGHACHHAKALGPHRAAAEAQPPRTAYAKTGASEERALELLRTGCCRCKKVCHQRLPSRTVVQTAICFWKLSQMEQLHLARSINARDCESLIHAPLYLPVSVHLFSPKALARAAEVHSAYHQGRPERPAAADFLDTPRLCRSQWSLCGLVAGPIRTCAAVPVVPSDQLCCCASLAYAAPMPRRPPARCAGLLRGLPPVAGNRQEAPRKDDPRADWHG